MSSSSSSRFTKSVCCVSSRSSAQSGTRGSIGMFEKASGSGVQDDQVDSVRRLVSEIVESNLPAEPVTIGRAHK